eukprot:EG_transcript_23613
MGAVYIRPGMFKSNRPQLLRDLFTMGSRTKYPNPIACLYSYTFWDYIRNSAGSLVLLGTLSRPNAMGTPLAVAVYFVGGICGTFSWMVQRQFKPSKLASEWDRASFASAATASLAGAAIAFPALRLVYRYDRRWQVPLLGVAGLWTAEALLEEYLDFRRGDPKNGVLRQAGVVGGLLLGLTVGAFLRSRASGLALVNKLQMAPK